MPFLPCSFQIHCHLAIAISQDVCIDEEEEENEKTPNGSINSDWLGLR